MKEIVLIIGGCRSGKSRYALKQARGFKRKVFVATCEVLDEEMKKRVEKHQEDRGPDWKTIEVPLALPDAIARCGAEADVILVDCLTLWISNMILKEKTEEYVMSRTDELLASIQKIDSTVILVSNEVGAGIVPENPLARMFRDVAGMVNQKVAACADKVVWMVAGIPAKVKG
ncbi:MAG: bifunctional adenosylcobinamide kinase/adenosylcobinamide-phosphate guanylyltransferase [Deltaproteobacteria bacterium]|nr:bifunctional adenosylcobinamide kinase/adenosylcobinamide-phosphate guanylyltransferase [Deltaproteobacteria bacterium]